MAKKWINEYVDCLNCLYCEGLNINKSFEIKQKHIPNNLYRFRPLSDNNDYEFENLENDKVWLNCPDNFNDPFDSKPLYNPDKLYNLLKNDSELKKFVTEKDADYINNLYHKTYVEYCKNYRIGCFTENNYTNILMWSHYANAHKGFCLKYDFTDKKQNIPENLLNSICPVIYSNQIFDITEYLYSSTKNVTAYLKDNNITRHFNNILLNLVVLFKSDIWSYENEWRIVMEKNLYKIENLIDVPKPSAIYIGLNTSNRNKAILKNISRKRKIDIFQIVRSPNEYKLQIEPLL